jgi:hypothetical protein
MLRINEEKAKAIAQNRIRAWREKQFDKNDVKLQNALADGDDKAKVVVVERRNWLRDLPQQCEGKTVEELKAFMIKLGVLEEKP